MKTHFVLLLALLLLGCGPGPVVWEHVIDAEADEAAAALATDGDNLLVLGTRTLPNGASAWLLQRLTMDGQLLCSRLYDEGETNVAGDVALAEDGTGYVVGTSLIQDQLMAVVARYGRTGNIIWHRGIALGEETRGRGICLDGDRVLICGSAVADGKQDLFVAELDTAGNTVWSRHYDLGPLDDAVRISAGREGALAVCGLAGAGKNTDILLARLEPDGDTVWTRRYDSGAPDSPGDVAFDTFGNVIATGTAGGDSPRLVIVEYHPDGELIRRAAYTEDAAAEGRAVATTGDGDIFFAGRLLGEGGDAMLAFHYRPNASSIWERVHRGGGDTGAADLVVAGDVFVLGTVERPGGSDMLLARFLRVEPPAGS